jgi:hypothetical protein
MLAEDQVKGLEHPNWRELGGEKAEEEATTKRAAGR